MTTTAEIQLSPLNLQQTLGCGQTFRWSALPDGSWQGPLRDQLITLSMSRERLLIRSIPGTRNAKTIVRSHLRAGDDVAAIQKTLAERDAVVARGMHNLKGLRIVRLDEWECLVSFALATYANIPRISKMIETLARRYGTEIVSGVYSFPTLEQMKRARLPDLSRCGLGYRAKYIHSISSNLSEGDLARFKRLPYDDLREKLKELPGVGDKVADCVALFGFGKLESFPIDVWMERSLARLYKQKGSYAKLAAFAHERFGEFAGYAQEYLYYNERAHAPNGACMFSKQRRDG